jgi:hypothetical protein
MRNVTGVLLAVGSLSLVACQSVGLQYKLPSAGEKSAELTGADGTFINNTNDKGCYYGRTAFSGLVRVRAGEPLVIGYENSYRPFGLGEVRVCNLLLSFTPAENARYRIWTDRTFVAMKNLLGHDVEEPACRIGVQQVMDDGELKSVPLEQIFLHRVKWNCIQFQTQAERDADEKAEEEADAREDAEDQARAAAKAKAKADAQARTAAGAVSKPAAY